MVFFGPTAVGKTELISSLFREGFEIINADSMQVYRHMDIGTAKPTLSVRSSPPHHLIDILDPKQQFTVGTFIKKADELVEKISASGCIPVIAGGTAFYLYTYLHGLPETPEGNPTIREEIRRELSARGRDALYRELLEKDPAAAENIQKNDVYRITRALEVIRSTGSPLSSFAKRKVLRADIHPCIIGLYREREELYRRIDDRVESMFKQGLVDEIKNLVNRGYEADDPGMQAIGYREFFDMKKIGCQTYPMVEELIKQHTRQYAKRQMTFFKKMGGVSWVLPRESERLASTIRRFLLREGVDPGYFLEL